VTARTGSAAADPQVEALEGGRAFVRLDDRRVVTVLGADARRWLHDLVTADVERLGPGVLRRTLLLTPTGRIRADLHVGILDGGFVLVQGPDQPEPVDRLLAPYVLSSDVQLADASERLAILAVPGPGRQDGWAPAGARILTPSPVDGGVTAIAGAGGPAAELAAALVTAGLEEVSLDALERWRIWRGVARMGPDFGTDALPAEVGLEAAIDFTKGCFLGQESVAKVRNLGHPPRVVVPVGSRARIVAGTPVLAGGRDVGVVTSVVEIERGAAAIATVRWGAVGGDLSTSAGPLTLR
jgi:hypothetical protein